MKWMRRTHLAAVALSAVIATTAVAVAQQPPSVTPMTPEMNPTYAYTRPEADFVRKTVMIPMRYYWINREPLNAIGICQLPTHR